MNDDLWTQLRAPFPPEDIDQLPRQNKRAGTTVMLDYVGHAAVTARLLDVDPESLWLPVAYDEQGLPRIIRRGDALELWMNLTVGGLTRLGVGTVPVEFDKDGKELPADQDTVKELVSDGIRNCAMRFGVALDLWRKHGPVEAAPTAPTGPPCPHCGTPVQFFDEKMRGKRPVWSCPNFGCGGGGAKKEGGGNWPWGSYDPNCFKEKENPDDPVDILKQVGLIGPPALVPVSAGEMFGVPADLATLNITEEAARGELAASAVSPLFCAGTVRDIRNHVNHAITIAIALGLAEQGILDDLWQEWRGEDATRKLLFYSAAKAGEIHSFAKAVQGWLRGIMGV